MMAQAVHFGWFQTNGYGSQGWGEPDFDPEIDWRDPEVYVRAAQRLEEAKFDLIVVEDSLVVPDDFEGSSRALLASGRFAPRQDPWAYAPIVLSRTKSIGLAPVLSAGFSDPYLSARQLTTLQQISRGRLGFNLVTSGNDRAAQNFGRSRQIPHDERYDRADEWLEVLRGLWRTWEPGALAEDLESRVFVDHTKVHPLEHDGRWYSVRGPLNAAPSDYGDPVIVQAGASRRGREFAGAHAQVVVSLPGRIDELRRFREDVRDRAVAAGRDRDDVKVLVVVTPIVAESEEDAEALRIRRNEVTQERLEETLATYSFLAGTDLSKLDPDAPVQDLRVEGDRGSFDAFVASAPSGSSLRDIVREHVRNDPRYLVGTPDQIADQLEDIVAGASVDGFLFAGRVYPRLLDRVLDPLVPVLRDRGLLRSEYVSDQLRENLGVVS